MIATTENMNNGSSLITLKLIVDPTLTKNTASKSPRNGFMLLSSSCLNSELASITPAKNAPNAGESPINVIRCETPTTKNSEVAVRSSFIPEEET